MPQAPNEVDKFFEDLPKENSLPRDIFNENPQKPADNQPPAPAPENGDDKDGDDDEGGKGIRKNRRHRRLEEQLERERSSNIQLNEHIKFLSGLVGKETDSTDEVPPEWTALMGDSPEAQKAWHIQSKLLQKVKADAVEEAFEKFQGEQNRVQQEQKQFESFIDTELESLEDEHGVDLTSNAPAARKARREFLEMVQRLSPKDENGSITGYADFEEVYNIYESSKKADKKPDPIVEKQKEIASKVITKPVSNSPAPQVVTPGFRGWQRDYNING